MSPIFDAVTDTAQMGVAVARSIAGRAASLAALPVKAAVGLLGGMPAKPSPPPGPPDQGSPSAPEPLRPRSERPARPARPVAPRRPAPPAHEPLLRDEFEPAAEDIPGVEAHVSEEATLVAEFADRGAEAGAGPEIHIDPPFEGYGRLKVAEIKDRLVGADPVLLAGVKLYESQNKRRRGVLDAVDAALAGRSTPA